MKSFLKNLIIKFTQIFLRIKITLLFHMRLKPKILKMKDFVKKIANIRRELFPFGKSLFVFPGKEDTLYFIIFKEETFISVMEVYDEVLNKIPEKYQLLPQIKFSEMLTSQEA